MNNTLIQIIIFPVVGIFLGGLSAFFFKLPNSVKSGLQHFAAGVVSLAVAVEIIPHLILAPILTVALGFSLGVVTMFLLKHVTEAGEKKEGTTKLSSLVIVILIDAAIDGMLLSFSLVAHPRAGLILSIALGIELAFLALTAVISAQRAGASSASIFVTLIAICACTCLGFFPGYFISGITPPWVFQFLLAFATAAFLYLVNEEILVEAHEERNGSNWRCAMFFVGFLALLLFDMALKH